MKKNNIVNQLKLFYVLPNQFIIQIDLLHLHPKKKKKIYMRQIPPQFLPNKKEKFAHPFTALPRILLCYHARQSQTKLLF